MMVEVGQGLMANSAGVSGPLVVVMSVDQLATEYVACIGCDSMFNRHALQHFGHSLDKCPVCGHEGVVKSDG
jgi:rRNA maturation endonuclease Nob1